MCLEFTFAILYFFILSIINFFLFQILRDSFRKVFVFLKFKNCFTLIDSTSSFFVPFLYSYLEKNGNYQKPQNLNLTKKITNDILILGNFYTFLQEKKKVESSIFYYTKLQENQFLNKKN
jgi:hypothetical protein